MKAKKNHSQSDTMTLKASQESLHSARKALEGCTTTMGFRIEHLRHHGRGSLAFSALQEGLEYYMHPEYGFIAYKPLHDGPQSVLVLSDPICKRENTKLLIDEFMKVRSDPVFLHISHEVAEIVAQYGYCVNEVGVETVVDIQEFDLVGSKKQQLRNARNGGKKDNLEIKEVDSIDNTTLSKLRKISSDWIKEKTISNNEMQFIVRPIVYVDEIDVRRFVALKDGEIVGFVIFDPMYENGEIVGYIAQHLRSIHKSTYSVVDCIVVHALELFKAEGKLALSMGFSPLARVDDQGEFKYSKLLKAYFQYAYEKANYLYNFKNLAQHKKQYRPGMKGAHEEKVYCAMRTRFLLPRIYDVFSTLGFRPISQMISHYSQKINEFISKPPKSDN
jgi:phosphatidylglycerol lysyltransferase